MRQHAGDFYGDLFRKEECNGEWTSYWTADRDVMNATISLEELTAAVIQMASGRDPSLNSLNGADFYKHSKYQKHQKSEGCLIQE